MTKEEIEALKVIIEKTEKMLEHIEIWKQNLIRVESLLESVESKEIVVKHACLNFTTEIDGETDQCNEVQIPYETFIKALKHCITYSRQYIERSDASMAEYKPVTLNFDIDDKCKAYIENRKSDVDKSIERENDSSSWGDLTWKKVRKLGRWWGKLHEG